VAAGKLVCAYYKVDDLDKHSKQHAYLQKKLSKENRPNLFHPIKGQLTMLAILFGKTVRL
jgi:hypothetical protein